MSWLIPLPADTTANSPSHIESAPLVAPEVTRSPLTVGDVVEAQRSHKLESVGIVAPRHGYGVPLTPV